MKKVLHITEAFGGGVQTALYSYVYSSRNEPIEHHLFARAREEDSTKENGNNQFQSSTFIDGNLVQFFLSANQRIKQLQPEVIHLHSSKAGFLGRFLTVGNAKLIYTPHCYAFEREDISVYAQKFYRILEGIRIKKFTAIAGCSQRECDLAISLGAKKAELLNNYVTYQSNAGNGVPRGEKINLVALGRVAKQKDPQFLCQVAEHILQHNSAIQLNITWIGGGDPSLEQQLRDKGIEVTGMLPRTEVVERLRNADIYLHTAAWEGMPLTILEAAKLTRPMVIRKIGATKDLDYPFLASTPQEMAKQIIHCVEHFDTIPFQQYCSDMNNTYSEEKQRLALSSLYI
ncbi:glycosyltransferase [Vibrio vulnificus]|uniref:glycosyltransferase n=1 Tax=Vibrio vulnificus TaxID=672 RepID=UPI00102A1FFD|nr:glycosyltransferase [Vibrio vulnificus]RZR37248.1 glycosyltransferase [Vibrio vulnificus]